MSSGAIIAIAIAVLVVLAVLVFVSAARRHDGRAAGALSRETRRRDRKARAASTADEAVPAEEAGLTGRAFEQAALAERSKELVPVVEAPPPPVVYSPPDADTVGYTRRAFFNRSIVAMMGISLAGFAGSMLAFLYPRKGGGFGSTVTIGKIDDIIKAITDSKGFYYVPDARTWVTAYPAEALPKATQAYGKQPPVLNGMKAGIVALYQKCPHLGCRVPQCETSQWFECPCHGSQYNRVGEKKGGPAPRGMDRFGVTVVNGVVSVDTSTPFLGPPIGTNTTGQEAEGPHCIGSVGGHA